MPRAQSIVPRDGQILMVKHRHPHGEWWCLPGGGIEDGETPEEATLRELDEECRVTGKIVRPTAVTTFAWGDCHYTFWVDIGKQEPVRGTDPEFSEDDQILVDLAWIRLGDLAERDRVFLWTAGLLSVPGFFEEVERWPREPSYPL